MSRTRHHSRKWGSPDREACTKRRAFGYEYWGRDAYAGADRYILTRKRRAAKRKAILEARRDQT